MAEIGSEQQKNIIEIWKAVVEVQKHFNDIEMRIRAMLVTILSALFASIGFMMDKKIYLNVFNVHVLFSTFIPLFGVFGAWLFYFIDRYWYHRLLLGAVNHAILIEQKYKDTIPELALGDAVRIASPYQPEGLTKALAKLLVSDERFVTSGRLHSDGKMELFYKSIMLVMLVVTLILAATGGVQFGDLPESHSPTASAPAPPK
jgi:hypothetical protein